MTSNRQLEQWRSEFGDRYTERNAPDWEKRLPAFTTMVGGLTLTSICEVGCNRGHNLRALMRIFPKAALAGIEPNGAALTIARDSLPVADLRDGHVFDIPFPDTHFDLVFTAGVLIHIALDDLPAAMREIVRVSRRYVLAVEYYAPTETSIEYRGHHDLLWKRDFLGHYRELFPALTLLRQGDLHPADGFDNCRWSLLDKHAG